MRNNIEQVFDFFNQICKIPRPSGKEGKVAAWLENFADKYKFDYIEVPVRAKMPPNVIIRVPASGGYESRPVLCLQAHTDMVCQKTPQSTHNFETDPIEMVVENGWIRAADTTLGADDGIGVAMAMAAAITEKHPRLELLFTVDEEGGLTGASALPGSQLEAVSLINLDSEDDVFIIGCAGGERFQITASPASIAAPADCAFYEISISGLLGGHSGVDIHKNRLNAIKTCGRLLDLLNQKIGVLLCGINGGSQTTAIARDVTAEICVPNGAQAAINHTITGFLELLRKENPQESPQIDFRITAGKSKVCGEQAGAATIALLNAITSGPVAYCKNFPEIVETSSSVGTVCFDASDGSFALAGSQRSSQISELDEISAKNRALAQTLGFDFSTSGRYQPWQPNTGSKLLKICRDVYRNINSREPKVEIIHAGLECGVIGGKYPNMDMVSFGPLIENAHSPSERVNIESVKRSYELLLGIIEACCEI